MTHRSITLKTISVHLGPESLKGFEPTFTQALTILEDKLIRFSRSWGQRSRSYVYMCVNAI